MPFFKIDHENSELLQGTTVYNSEYHLLEEEHENYVYPIDGWYWFENIGQAINAFAELPAKEINTDEVPALNALIAMEHAGIRDAFEAWANAPERTRTERDFIQRAQSWKRNNPVLIAGAKELGLSKEHLDDLFKLAASIVL